MASTEAIKINFTVDRTLVRDDKCTNYTDEEKNELVDREQFNKLLIEYYENKVNKKPFTRESLDFLTEQIHIARGKSFRKTRREYYILKTYDIAFIEGREQIIRKSDNLPVIAFEDLYDVIFEFHVMRTKHAGKTKLEVTYKQSNVNVPRPATEAFLRTCRECTSDKDCRRKRSPVKTKCTRGFSNRGQIDIIDFHKMPQENFTCVLAYQDYYTKFLILRPLKDGSPEVVAIELLHIFALFGAPNVLESLSGEQFISTILNHLNGIWSQKIIACGKPTDEEGPSRTPADIEAYIRSWMVSESNANWVSGLNTLQWQANVSATPGFWRRPYEALFGIMPRSDLLPPILYAPSISHNFMSNPEDYSDNSTAYEEDIKPDVSAFGNETNTKFSYTSICPNWEDPMEEQENSNRDSDHSSDQNCKLEDCKEAETKLRQVLNESTEHQAGPSKKLKKA